MRQLKGKGLMEGESKGCGCSTKKYLETGMHPEKTSLLDISDNTGLTE